MKHDAVLSLDSYELLSFEYRNRETVLIFLGPPSETQNLLPMRTIYLFDAALSGASIVLKGQAPHLVEARFEKLSELKRPFQLRLGFANNHYMLFKCQEYFERTGEVPFTDVQL